MKIESIGWFDSLGNIANSNQNKIQKEGNVFEDFYKAAMGLVEQTNTLQRQAEQIGLDFAMGKTDNIHNVMIAQEKAGTALQFTVQIHNKVLEAYREIMRIQI
jgi:flagellar hook-basal body complex protein FliE